MAHDALLYLRERPLLVERGVRAALIEAMMWRHGGGAAPRRAAFACAAVTAVRRRSSQLDLDGAARFELAARAERAALRFFASSLGRRLMSVPVARIVRAPFSPGGADVGVTDAAGQLHLISITALWRPFELAEHASRLAAEATLAPREQLGLLHVHLYSLRTGDRHDYGRRPAPGFVGLARSA